VRSDGSGEYTIAVGLVFGPVDGRGVVVCSGAVALSLLQETTNMERSKTLGATQVNALERLRGGTSEVEYRHRDEDFFRPTWTTHLQHTRSLHLTD